MRWTALVLVAGAFVVAVVLASRFGIDPSLRVSPLIDEPAPSRELPLLGAAGTIDVGRLPGQVVVVNFWGPWCIWCDDEHPELLATSEAYSDKNVQFVGIAFKTNEELASQFLDRYGWGDHFSYAVDEDLTTTINFGVRGAPETFFIDPNGIIVGKISGPTNALLLSQTIEQILAGQTPGSRTVGDIQTGPDS